MGEHRHHHRHHHHHRRKSKMKKLVKGLGILAYVGLCAVGLVYIPVRIVCWVLALLIAFIFMAKEAPKLIGPALIMAVVCCILAYVMGTVKGIDEWTVSFQNEPAFFGGNPLKEWGVSDYSLYRWSTYFSDCAMYTLIAWMIGYVVHKMRERD